MSQTERKYECLSCGTNASSFLQECPSCGQNEFKNVTTTGTHKSPGEVAVDEYVRYVNTLNPYTPA